MTIDVRPSVGRSSTWSSRAPTVTSKPRSVPSWASRVAMDSAVPRLDPNSTDSGVPCRGTSRDGPSARPRAGTSSPSALTRGRPGAVDVHAGTRTDLDVEVVGLDGQRGLGPQLVVEVVNELEPLQQHAQHQRGLLQGELAPDAGALPGAERLVDFGGHRGQALGGHVLGVELRASGPQIDRSRCSAGVSTVIAVSAGRAYRPPITVSSRGRRREPGCGRPQPQRLVEHLADVGQPVHLLERGSRPCCRAPRRPRPAPGRGSSGFFSR